MNLYPFAQVRCQEELQEACAHGPQVLREPIELNVYDLKEARGGYSRGIPEAFCVGGWVEGIGGRGRETVLRESNVRTKKNDG